MADGDKVVARVSYRGTHQGAFRGIAPTGKQIAVMGINIFRIANGKLVEHWGLTDRLAVLHQVGVVRHWHQRAKGGKTQRSLD